MLTFRQLVNYDEDFLGQNNIQEPKTKWSPEVQKPLETQLSFLLKEPTCFSSGKGSLTSSCMLLQGEPNTQGLSSSWGGARRFSTDPLGSRTEHKLSGHKGGLV